MLRKKRKQEEVVIVMNPALFDAYAAHKGLSGNEMREMGFAKNAPVHLMGRWL